MVEDTTVERVGCGDLVARKGSDGASPVGRGARTRSTAVVVTSSAPTYVVATVRGTSGSAVVRTTTCGPAVRTVVSLGVGWPSSAS